MDNLCNQKQKINNLKIKIGFCLVIFSWIIYSFIFIIPFWPAVLNLKLIIGSILYLLSHAFFWIGVLILGRKFSHKYKGFDLLNRLKKRIKDWGTITK